MSPTDPVARKAEKADETARRREVKAAWALTKTEPTTVTGILALIHYVEAFNDGLLKHPTAPDEWKSNAFYWPVDGFEEDGCGDPPRFAFDLLSLVGRSLRRLAPAA
jgi:hypothetical protein